MRKHNKTKLEIKKRNKKKKKKNRIHTNERLGAFVMCKHFHSSRSNVDNQMIIVPAVHKIKPEEKEKDKMNLHLERNWIMFVLQKWENSYVEL